MQVDRFLAIIDIAGSNPDAAHKRVIRRIEKFYPDHYIHPRQGNLIFIRTSDITTQISQKIGIDGETKLKDISGMIVKLTYYHGRTANSIWEWMAKSNT